MRKGVTTQLSVSIYYDDEQMTQEQAINWMHNTLSNANCRGHFDDAPVDLEFGNDWDPQPFDPVSDD